MPEPLKVTVYAVRLRTEPSGPVYSQIAALHTRRGFSVRLFSDPGDAEEAPRSIKKLWSDPQLDSTAAVVPFRLEEQRDA